jgi:hypothetical protein
VFGYHLPVYRDFSHVRKIYARSVVYDSNPAQEYSSQYEARTELLDWGISQDAVGTLRQPPRCPKPLRRGAQRRADTRKRLNALDLTESWALSFVGRLRLGPRLWELR